ncbi:MAG: DUF6029 family protein [Candidatus Hydrothermia bacterium]
MRILTFFLLSLNLSLEGEYRLERGSLADYFFATGSVDERFGKLSFGFDYIMQINSSVTTGRINLIPYLGGKFGFFQLSLLHFQKSLLGGMLLNAEHNVPLKLKRYIKGGGVEFYSGPFKAGLFTGQMIFYGFDQNSYFVENDTLDNLRALDLELDLSSFSLEGSYVRLNTRNMPASYSFDEIYGGKINLNLPFVLFQLQGALRRGVDPVLYEIRRGYGFYFTSQFTSGNLSFSLGSHYYDSLRFLGYNTPPVLTERELLPGNGNSDKALSMGFSYSPGSYYFEFKASSVIDPGERNFFRPQSGKALEELFFKGNFNLWRGMRMDFKAGRDFLMGVEPEYEKLYTYYLSLGANIPSLKELDLEIKPAFNREDDVNYWSLSFEVGFKLPSDIVPVFTVDYNSVKLARFENENFWPYLEIRRNFEYGYFLLGVGAQKGGLVCSGGICRYVNPFKGLKVSLNLGI